MIYINISVIPSQGGLGFLCSCGSSIIIVVIIHIIFLHINNDNSRDYPTNTSSIVYLFLNHWLICGKNSSIGVKVNSLSFEERNEKRHYSTSTLNATEPNYYRTITGDWLTKTIQNCPLNNVQHTTYNIPDQAKWCPFNDVVKGYLQQIVQVHPIYLKEDDTIKYFPHIIYQHCFVFSALSSTVIITINSSLLLPSSTTPLTLTPVCDTN